MNTSNYHSASQFGECPSFQDLWGGGGAAGLSLEAEVLATRERIGMTLWYTVEQTFAEDVMTDERKVAPMLSVRIRALGQLAKLYLGKKKTSRRKEFEQVEPATPEEISALVREWRERQVPPR